jgi:formylmethanofuran dehydrogenase subunit E
LHNSPQISGNTKEDRQRYLYETPPENLFAIKEVPFALPERAHIFSSLSCENCGEKTAENHIRLKDGKKICEDCFSPYGRTL